MKSDTNIKKYETLSDGAVVYTCNNISGIPYSYIEKDGTEVMSTPIRNGSDSIAKMVKAYIAVQLSTAS